MTNHPRAEAPRFGTAGSYGSSTWASRPTGSALSSPRGPASRAVPPRRGTASGSTTWARTSAPRPRARRFGSSRAAPSVAAGRRTGPVCQMARSRPSSLLNLPEYERSALREDSVERLVQRVRAKPPPRRDDRSPALRVLREDARAHEPPGSTPVIVLNPVYPTVLAKLESTAFPQRKAIARVPPRTCASPLRLRRS